MRHSQHSRLWIEWLRRIDLVENGACVHQDLPDVVVIPSTRAQGGNQTTRLTGKIGTLKKKDKENKNISEVWFPL